MNRNNLTPDEKEELEEAWFACKIVIFVLGMAAGICVAHAFGWL